MSTLIHQTHAMGITALITAALVAVARRERGWSVMAGMLLAMALTIMTNVSWVLHDAAAHALASAGAYPNRGVIQIALIAATVPALLLVVAWCWRLNSHAVNGGQWRWLMACVTMALLVGLFVIQAISLHVVDAMLSRQVGPVLLVGWLWFVGSIAMIIAAQAGHHRR